MKVCLGIPSWNRLSVLSDYLNDLTELSSVLAPEVNLAIYVYLQEDEKQKASVLTERYPHIHFGIVDAYPLEVKHGKIIQGAQFWFRDTAKKECPDIYIWSDDDIRVRSSRELGQKLKGMFRHFLEQPKVGCAAVSEFPSRQTSELSFVSTETDKTIHPKNQVWELTKAGVFENERLLSDPIFQTLDIAEDVYTTLKVLALGYHYGEYTGLLNDMYVPDVSEGDEGGFFKRIKGHETAEHSERYFFAYRVGVSPMDMYSNILIYGEITQHLNPCYDYVNEIGLDPKNNTVVEKVATSYWQQSEQSFGFFDASKSAEVVEW